MDKKDFKMNAANVKGKGSWIYFFNECVRNQV